MKKVDIKKVAGVSALSLGLVVGLAGFAGASSGTIGTTGPDSNNQVTHDSEVDLDYENDNEVNLSNHNKQYASSGEVEVEHNTTGGDARSGSAANANSVSATVEVKNSQVAAPTSGGGSNSGSINNTGPDSNNQVKFESDTEVRVDNENDVRITNTNHQSSHSGDAEVSDNTTGGDATSGNASNTSSSSFTVRVSN
jgi:hypothetical protein